jgi:hypothetical protein
LGSRIRLLFDYGIDGEGSKGAVIGCLLSVIRDQVEWQLEGVGWERKLWACDTIEWDEGFPHSVRWVLKLEVK